MYRVVKKYGNVVETTEQEKEPSKVRVSRPRKRRDVYGRRRLDNIRRTKRICMRRVSSAIAAFGNPLLVTLTFVGDASNAAYANDSIRRFQVRLRNKYPEAQSLFVPELSPKGRIHVHGLLFNVPMHLGDIKKGRRVVSRGTERKTRTLASIWGEGFVDAKQTNGSYRLAGYLSKYIVKAADEVIFNAMRMLRISHGFPKEEILRGEDADKVFEEYKDKEPNHEWNGENTFSGKISKKKYYLE